MSRVRIRQGAPQESSALMPGDIDAIWHDVDDTLAVTYSENQQIAMTANCWSATASGVEKQNRKALAKAHKILFAWCSSQNREAERFLESLLPDLIEIGEERFAQHCLNGSLLLLERALIGVRDLIQPLPKKQATWVMIAQMVWQDAEHILLSRERVAGTSAKAIAIIFTSKVLVRIGYSADVFGATPNGVSKEIKKFVALRGACGVVQQAPVTGE